MPLKKSEQERKLEGTDHLERKIFLYIQKTVNAEMAPIYQLLNQFARTISKLENRVSDLEKQYGEISGIWASQPETPKENGNSSIPPVIFQEIKVEKLFIEKFDQANNLGTIGIKELSGHLNIGTTYEKAGLGETSEESKGEFEELKGKYKEKMGEIKEKGNKDDS
ncbi:hypothetical protein DRW41_05765 [Neobacillus piezotolerans]|uniref:Uncharacterized protein n=1 Tax=Neobacillus piezotolerans TaxID=2259171 RepID=A0A3D8GSR5_9BACI|nr:hypothetical protein [Neobacillus piezotolerans]RDU37352.1 hypothetical protein DRW41_05765 [Neobacillus piezotolerans]